MAQILAGILALALTIVFWQVALIIFGAVFVWWLLVNFYRFITDTQPGK